jgi:glycosyltransferase involved in cell wall biosynthesis
LTAKTIFINGRFLTQPVTGVQRHSLELLRHIDLILADGTLSQVARFVCLAPREKFAHPGWENIEIRLVGVNTGNLWEQIDLPMYARGEMLFSPANIGPCYYRNQVVTFHDASVFAVPEAYSWSFRAKYSYVFRQLSQRARRILTVSDFSGQQLARYLKIAPARFTVIPNGSNHLDVIEPDTQILQRNHLTKGSYLFMVASQSAHKNLRNVFEALKLVKTDIKVVAAGGSFKRVFQDTGVQEYPANVQILGYINDRELKALYENALGFIFPSTYEGFGLPMLEAMRCGCPVLCSNAASLPEVAGEAALYFDPHQVDDIARVFNDFLSTPQLHEELRLKGLQQAARFEWSATAQQTLEVLLGL